MMALQEMLTYSLLRISHHTCQVLSHIFRDHCWPYLTSVDMYEIYANWTALHTDFNFDHPSGLRFPQHTSVNALP